MNQDFKYNDDYSNNDKKDYNNNDNKDYNNNDNKDYNEYSHDVKSNKPNQKGKNIKEKIKKILKKVGEIAKKVGKKIIVIAKRLAVMIKRLAKKLYFKVKELSKKKNGPVIIGAGVVSIIALTSLIVCIVLISTSGTSALKKESWKDLVISIDGHTIKLGEKISTLEKIGFTSNDENYKGELSQSFTSGGISFDYEDLKQENDIYFSAYNPDMEAKKVIDCEINGIELSHEFYKNYKVILPGGIVLNEKLNINEIIKEWGKPTKEETNSYSWIDGNNQIRIYTNEDKTIFSLVYNS